MVVDSHSLRRKSRAVDYRYAAIVAALASRVASAIVAEESIISHLVGPAPRIRIP